MKRRRRSTEAFLSRLFELLVLTQSSTGGPNRSELAVRWRCTPRAVSHLLALSRQRFGVRLEVDPLTGGYRLRDAGVFNMAAVARRQA